MSNPMVVRLPVINSSQVNSLEFLEFISSVKRLVHDAEQYLIAKERDLKGQKRYHEKVSAMLDFNEKQLNEEKMRREGSSLPSCPKSEEVIDFRLKAMEEFLASMKILLKKNQNEKLEAERAVINAEVAVIENRKVLQYLLQTYKVEGFSEECGAKFNAGAVTVSKKFEGVPLLEEDKNCTDRMENEILKAEMPEIHRFTQKTLTPEQWEKNKQ